MKPRRFGSWRRLSESCWGRLTVFCGGATIVFLASLRKQYCSAVGHYSGIVNCEISNAKLSTRRPAGPQMFGFWTPAVYRYSNIIYRSTEPWTLPIDLIWNEQLARICTKTKTINQWFRTWWENAQSIPGVVILCAQQLDAVHSVLRVIRDDKSGNRYEQSWAQWADPFFQNKTQPCIIHKIWPCSL